MPDSGGLLTLDLSGRCGWAYGTGPIPERYGLWTLRQTHRGARFDAFRTKLGDALAEWRPGEVCMEAPLPLPAQTSASSARQQYGLAAYVEGECAEAGIYCRELEIDYVRRLVIGRTRAIRAPKGSASEDLLGMPAVVTVKAMVVAHVRSLGLPVADDNMADAIVVYLAVHAERRRQVRIRRLAA